MAARRVGKYLIISSLGEGTFGKVKLAVHEDTGAQVALKIMDKSDIIEQAFTVYVRREIAIMKALTHRNIVKLHHVLTSHHKLYLVMEAVNGGELWALISRSENGLPEDLARLFFVQLVDGVHYCHRRGVVHRDLKPENILITSNGDLKITDFGLSAIKIAGRTNELLQTACGTPNYISPEVLEKRNKGYDGRKLDVWSCGIILFSLLVGYLPFDRKTQQEVVASISNDPVVFPPWVSEDARDLINRMLEKDPKKRITLHNVKQHPWYLRSYILRSPSPKSSPSPDGQRRHRKSKTRRRHRPKQAYNVHEVHRKESSSSPSPSPNPKNGRGNQPARRKARAAQTRRPHSYDDGLSGHCRAVARNALKPDNLNRRRSGALTYCTKDRAVFSNRTLGGEAEARRRGLLGINSTLVIARIDSDIQPGLQSQREEKDNVSDGVGKIRRIQTMLAISKSELGGEEMDSKGVLDVLLGKIEGLHIQKEGDEGLSTDNSRSLTSQQQHQQTIQISPSFLLGQAPGGKDAFIDALRYVRDRLASEMDKDKSRIDASEADGARELLDLWEKHLATPQTVEEGNKNHNRSNANGLKERRTVEVHMDWVMGLQKLLKSWDQAVVGDDSAAEELKDNEADFRPDTCNPRSTKREKVIDEYSDGLIHEEYSTEFDSDCIELDDIPGMVNVSEEVRLQGSSSSSSSSRSKGSSNLQLQASLNIEGDVPKTESHQLREKNGVNEISFMNNICMVDVNVGVNANGSTGLSGFVNNNDLRLPEVPFKQASADLDAFWSSGPGFPEASTSHAGVAGSGAGERLQESNASKDPACTPTPAVKPNRRKKTGVAKSELENVPTVPFEKIEEEFSLGRERDEYVDGPPASKTNRRKSRSPSNSSRGALRRSSRGSRGAKNTSSGKLSAESASSSREGRSLKWLPFSGARNTAQFDSFLKPKRCLYMLGQMLQKNGADVHQKRDELKLKCYVMLREGKMTFTVDFYESDTGGSTVVFKRIDKTFNRSLDSNTFRDFFNKVVSKFSTVNTVRPSAISAP